MIKIGQYNFPETEEEAERWHEDFEHFTWTALYNPQILVVAKTRIERKWCAYIMVVPGKCHDEEWKKWKTEGTKIPPALARAIYGSRFDPLPYDWP